MRIVLDIANTGEQWQIVANSDEQSIVTVLDLISALINYPNKQRNFSEFITFSSQDSG